MRKLLLLFAMCLATIGARAYNYPGNNASAVQDYGDGKTVCFYVDGSTGNQILNVGAGGLAEWFNAASDTEKGYLNSTHTKLVISGTMNAGDFAVLTGSTWQAYTVVDMSGVTTEASPLVVAFPNVEYLLLPNGYTTSDLSGLNTNNPKLKAAGSKATLTGQTVPAWAYEETTSTVTKYYTDSEYNTEYTAGDQFEENDNWYGYVQQDTEKTLTVASTATMYTNTWANNRTYDATGLTVTDGKVSPNPFDVALTTKYQTSCGTEVSGNVQYDSNNDEYYIRTTTVYHRVNTVYKQHTILYYVNYNYYLDAEGNQQYNYQYGQPVGDGNGGYYVDSYWYDQSFTNPYQGNETPTDDGSGNYTVDQGYWTGDGNGNYWNRIDATVYDDCNGGYYYIDQNGNTRQTVTLSYYYTDQNTGTETQYTGTTKTINGSLYGELANPLNGNTVEFTVATSYTYSYEDCNGNTVTMEPTTEVLTTTTISCTVSIPLYPRDEEVTTVAENRTPQTLTNQTLNQLSLYCFQKNEAVNFANKFLTITNTNSAVIGVDKLCMAGPSLGRGDLINTNTASGNGLWQNTKYFDFTGAKFDNATIHIKSAGTYNGTFGSQSMTNETNIEGDIATNEFYYFTAMAGNVITCVLPTGNTEIPPMTFYTSSGTAYGFDGSPLLEINIPNTYTKIGFEAFNRTKIQTLYIPGSITTVEEGAFSDCFKLINVEMEASATSCTFQEKSFANCKEMKFFTMAEGVTGIPYQMFSYCANLESIRIPSTCKSIGDFAFDACASLHSVTIPEGVERMDHAVFRLSGLTDIYVMAKTLDKVPLIYNTGMDGNSIGTFLSNNLNGNDGTAPNDHITGNSIGSPTHKGYFDTNSQTALSYYQENYSDGGYLGSGNCFTYFHFPDEMKWFYDAVPGFQNAGPNNNVNDLHTYAEIVEAAKSPYWLDGGDGSQWPYDQATSFSAAYHWEDREATKGDPNITDKVNKTWPSREDMITRRAAGGSNDGQQSYWGWRQFSLMNSVSDTGEENFERKYDDTWYTMCFPWRMTDNQLFDTFNQKCEITEFKGAEVIETGENEYSLVLHFDDVAGTYYMDDADHKYARESDGTYEVRVNGTVVTLNKYKYTQLDASGNPTSTVVTFDKDNPMNNTLYNQIANVMVLAGHPYMIHPSIGANPGSPVTCYITGVKRKAKSNDEITYLEADGAVTRTATTGDATTAFTSPLGEGGTYTFKGYLGRNLYTLVDGKPVKNEDYNEANDKGDIPQYSYFLATKNSNYPKYFREMANPAATGKWTLYTAIITPDADAIQNIEKLEGATVQNSANVAFGEWEQVEATAIEQIIADAQERGEEVREIHMNVVYNINGQVVRTDGQIEGLPKGLYIVNGKKYMVK